MVVKKTSLESRGELLATAVFKEQASLAQINSTFSSVARTGGDRGTPRSRVAMHYG